MSRRINPLDYFTEEEAKIAFEIYEKGGRASEVRDKIVAPVIGRINEATGQENDPGFWAYALEYVYTQIKK
jgi:hypothetical protein